MRRIAVGEPWDPVCLGLTDGSVVPSVQRTTSQTKLGPPVIRNRLFAGTGLDIRSTQDTEQSLRTSFWVKLFGRQAQRRIQRRVVDQAFGPG